MQPTRLPPHLPRPMPPSSNSWKRFRNRNGAREWRFPNHRGDSEIALPPPLVFVDFAGVILFRGRTSFYFSLRSTDFSARKFRIGKLADMATHDKSSAP